MHVLFPEEDAGVASFKILRKLVLLVLDFT